MTARRVNKLQGGLVLLEQHCVMDHRLRMSVYIEQEANHRGQENVRIYSNVLSW